MKVELLREFQYEPFGNALYDVNSNKLISPIELHYAYADLSAVGYKVKLSPIGTCLSGPRIPIKGTVTDVDANWVFVEGEDGESYNIPRESFHAMYVIAD